MVSTEIHMLWSLPDVFSAEFAGLDVLRRLPYVCSHCGKPVGFLCGEFVPVGLCMDGDSEWLLCAACASPVISPGVLRTS